MLGLDDHSDAFGRHKITECLSNLIGHTLLHLESTRVGFDETGHLGQTDNASVRNIGDVYLPEKRKEMVLAE